MQSNYLRDNRFIGKLGTEINYLQSLNMPATKIARAIINRIGLAIINHDLSQVKWSKRAANAQKKAKKIINRPKRPDSKKEIRDLPRSKKISAREELLGVKRPKRKYTKRAAKWFTKSSNQTNLSPVLSVG